MTATRQQARQTLLDEDITGGLHGTATAGAAGTLTDTTLLQVGAMKAALGDMSLSADDKKLLTEVLRLT